METTFYKTSIFMWSLMKFNDAKKHEMLICTPIVHTNSLQKLQVESESFKKKLATLGPQYKLIMYNILYFVLLCVQLRVLYAA